jgi:[protein-PII] uridylyltransferase
VELLTVSTRRANKENAIKNNKAFQKLSKTQQKKILQIESNQLFLKYKALDIIKIALKAMEVQNYYFHVSNKEQLQIRITREVPLNLGYLLGKLQFLNISSMGIYKLFEQKKFFEINFDEHL